jgi:hypothetical protein
LIRRCLISSSEKSFNLYRSFDIRSGFPISKINILLFEKQHQSNYLL